MMNNVPITADIPVSRWSRVDITLPDCKATIRIPRRLVVREKLCDGAKWEPEKLAMDIVNTITLANPKLEGLVLLGVDYDPNSDFFEVLISHGSLELVAFGKLCEKPAIYWDNVEDWHCV